MENTDQIEVYTRNPLGLIALFLTFIYGIAGGVIGANFGNLKGQSERLPLIWFIVIFPFVILGVFVYLVVKHNEKLYAPKNFDNQEGFLIANGKQISPNKETKPLDKPEIIPVNKNNFSLVAFSTPQCRNDIAIKLQEAALKKYSVDHDMEIKTEVRMSNRFVCDGISEKNGETYLFEVKSNYSPTKDDAIFKNIEIIKKQLLERGNWKLHIVLILVSEKYIEHETINRIRNQAREIVQNLDIVNYVHSEISKE